MEEAQEILKAGLKMFLSNLLPAATLLAVGIPAVRGVIRLLEKLLGRSHLEPVACNLVKRVAKGALFGLLGLTVASALGVDITGIVTLAGVLTLAISLSVQNALTNLISGFTLLYTRPFVSGDLVEIAGQSGVVREVGLTYTKLAAPDNKSISIPNGAVTAAQIVNFTTLGTRRVEVTVWAAYHSPVEGVLEALRRAAAVPTALDTPPVFAGVQTYGESAIGYVLLVWTSAENYWTTLFAVNKRIKECFEEMGVSMTYPHLNVHLDKKGKE